MYVVALVTRAWDAADPESVTFDPTEFVVVSTRVLEPVEVALPVVAAPATDVLDVPTAIVVALDFPVDDTVCVDAILRASVVDEVVCEEEAAAVGEEVAATAVDWVVVVEIGATAVADVGTVVVLSMVDAGVDDDTGSVEVVDSVLVVTGASVDVVEGATDVEVVMMVDVEVDMIAVVVGVFEVDGIEEVVAGVVVGVVELFEVEASCLFWSGSASQEKDARAGVESKTSTTESR